MRALPLKSPPAACRRFPGSSPSFPAAPRTPCLLRLLPPLPLLSLPPSPRRRRRARRAVCRAAPRPPARPGPPIPIPIPMLRVGSPQTPNARTRASMQTAFDRFPPSILNKDRGETIRAFPGADVRKNKV